jgi:hypothetical protein
MDVSDLRKAILRSLDDARKDAATRRASGDKAAADYEKFLGEIAVPLFRQAATVLKAEGHPFSVHTPSGSVRLVSEHAADDFLELALDSTGDRPQVVGRLSVTRGRRSQLLDERPIARDTSIDALTEDDVSKFLIDEVRRLVVR